MNLRKELTRIECDRFRQDCNFTPWEEKVFDMVVRDCSRVEISMTLQMSVSTVDRHIHSIKRKIAKVSC